MRNWKGTITLDETGKKALKRRLEKILNIKLDFNPKRIKEESDSEEDEPSLYSECRDQFKEEESDREEETAEERDSDGSDEEFNQYHSDEDEQVTMEERYSDDSLEEFKEEPSDREEEVTAEERDTDVSDEEFKDYLSDRDEEETAEERDSDGTDREYDEYHSDEYEEERDSDSDEDFKEEISEREEEDTAEEKYGYVSDCSDATREELSDEEENYYSETDDESKFDFSMPYHLKTEIEELTAEQNRAFCYVKKLLTDPQFRKTHSKIVCVCGPAGTGKTEVLRLLHECVKYSRGTAAIAVASTGVAALNYKEGRTAHSMFNFPFDVYDDGGVLGFSRWNRETIMKTMLIVYDEVNMVDNRLISMLDRSLRDLMNSEKPFGGKIVIFAGDFLQVGPVKGDITKLSLKVHPLWQQMKIYPLTILQRTKADPGFTNFLLKLGRDDLPTHNIREDDDSNYVALKNIDFTFDFKEAIKFVFPKHVLGDPDMAARRAILTPQNNLADLINVKVIQQLKGNLVTFVAQDEINADDFSSEPYFFSESFLKDKAVPPKKLLLKEGCMCMIVRNIYQPTTLLRGAKVIVQDISSEEILIRKPGEKGNSYSIERHKFYVSLGKGRGLIRKQFPFKLCYATTFHKSQGQTLDKLVIDFRDPIYTHGLSYMALSRVRTRKDVKVLVEPDQVAGGIAYVSNSVNQKMVE